MGKRVSTALNVIRPLFTRLNYSIDHARNCCMLQMNQEAHLAVCKRLHHARWTRTARPVPDAGNESTASASHTLRQWLFDSPPSPTNPSALPDRFTLNCRSRSLPHLRSSLERAVWQRGESHSQLTGEQGVQVESSEGHVLPTAKGPQLNRISSRLSRPVKRIASLS